VVLLITYVAVGGWQFITVNSNVLVVLAVANPSFHALCISGVGGCQPVFKCNMCQRGWRSPTPIQVHYVLPQLAVANPSSNALSTLGSASGDPPNNHNIILQK
jgi:hypothetical protein